MSAKVRWEHARQIVRLACEGHEIGAGTAPAWKHVLDGLCDMIGARYGAMVEMVNFGAGGLAAINLSVLSAGYAGEARAARLVEALSVRVATNPAAESMMADARPGAVVTVARRDLLDDKSWYRSPFIVEYARPAGQDDCLLSARVSSAGRSTGLAFTREWGQAPFKEDERAALHLFMLDCVPSFTRRSTRPAADSPELAGGPRLVLAGDPATIASRPVPRGRLAPRAQATLEMLLSGYTDKEVAERLSITGNTVRDYVKAIFRAYGVSSRAQLLALHL